MSDLANLVIGVDARQVAPAGQALDKLATSGATAEKAMDGVTNASKKLDGATGTTKASVDGVKTSLDQLIVTEGKTSVETEKLAGSTNKTKTANDQLKEAVKQLSEQLAKQMADATKLIEKLDPLSAKAQEVAAQYAAMIKTLQGMPTQPLNQTSESMAKVGMSAAAMSNAMRMVPAQFTDIAVSLAGGQPPMMVMLQQGGQLKDMFGGIVPAARALGTYIAGLVNPLTLAAAGIAAFGYAAFKGNEEVKEFNKAIQMSGGYAGATRQSMQELAASISASSTLTIGAAKALTVELVNSGRFGSAALKEVTKAADNMAYTLGKSAEEVGPDLIKMFADPVKSMDEMNKQFHFLSVAMTDHIQHLVRIGDLEGAQVELAKAWNDNAPKRVDNLGSLERAWILVSKAASGAWNAMLGVGKEKTLEQQLAEVEASLLKTAGQRGRVNGIFQAVESDQELKNQREILKLTIQEGQTAIADKEIVVKLQEKELAARKLSESSAVGQRAKLVDQLSLLEKFGIKDEQTARAIFEKKKEIFELDRSTAEQSNTMLRQRLEQELQSYKQQYDNGIAIYESMLKQKQITQEEFAYAKERLELEKNQREQINNRALLAQKNLRQEERQKLDLELQGLKAAERKIKIVGDLAILEAQNAKALEVQKEYAKQLEEINNSGNKEIENLDKKIAALRLSNAEIGKTAEQKELEKAKAEELEVLRVREEAAYLRMSADRVVEQDQNENIARQMREKAGILEVQVDRMEEVAKLSKEAAQLTKNAETAKKLEDDWKKVAEGIEGNFKKAFTGIFDAGKTGWKAMVDSFKAMFKSAVIDYIYTEFAKKWVFNIIANIAGMTGATGLANAATSLAGGAATSGATATGVGGWLSAGSSLKSAWDAITGAPSALYNNFATSSIGSSLGLSAPAAAGLSTGGEPFIANAITGMGQTVGTALSYVGAGLAGIAIGQTIAGDKIVMGVSGTVTSSIGAIIGGLAGGPLGALVGGSLGGVVNRAFGMGPKNSNPASLVGTLTGSGFSGNYQSNWTQSGGWFRSDKSGTDYSSVSNEQLDSFRLVVQGFGATFQKLLDVSGSAGKSLETYSGYVNRELNTQAQMDEFIKDIAFSIGTYMVTGLHNFQKAGENLADTAVRLTDEFIVTNNIAMLLGKDVGWAFGSIGIASLGMRDQLIELMGGMTNASNIMQSYYQNFFSESERHANSVKALQVQFAAIGQVMPETREGFRALVEKVSDLGTTAGQQTFVALMNLQQAFAAVVPASQSVATALTGPSSPLGLFMTDIQTQYRAINAMPVSDFEKAMSELLATQEATIAKAKELGASENQLAMVRLLNAKQTEQLTQAEADRVAKEKAANSAALANQMKGVDYSLATIGLDAFAKSIYDVHKAADEATANASATNAAFEERSAALIKIRQLETLQVNQLTEAEKARVDSLNNDKRIQILELEGNTVDALAAKRQLEVVGMDETTLSLQLRIYKLQDEATATALANAEAEKKAADDKARTDALAATYRKNDEQRIQILELEGNSVAALGARRVLEMQGMSGTTLMLQERIYNLQDEATALAKTNEESAKKVAAETALAEQMKGVDYQLLVVGASAYKKTILDINIAQAAAMEQARANGAAETGSEILRIQKLGDLQRAAAKSNSEASLSSIMESVNYQKLTLGIDAYKKSLLDINIQMSKLMDQARDAGAIDGGPEIAAIQTLWHSLRDAAKAAEELRLETDNLNTSTQLATEKQSLQVSLLRAYGLETEAQAAQRAIDIQGMSLQNIAAYDLNKEMQGLIDSLTKASQNAAELKTHMDGVDYQRNVFGLSAFEKALYDINKATNESVTKAQSLGASPDEIDRIVEFGSTQLQKVESDERKRLADEATAKSKAQADALGSLQEQLFSVSNTEEKVLARSRELKLQELALKEVELGLQADSLQSIQRQIDVQTNIQKTERDTAAQRTSMLKTYGDLEITLLQAQGREQDATNLSRQNEINALYSGNVALQESINARLNEIDAARLVTAELARQSETAKSLAASRATTEIDLLKAQGQIAAASSAQRAIDIQGMNAANVAAYDYNQLLKDQIQAISDAAAAKQKADEIAKQQRALDIQLMDAQGNATGALAARRADELASLDASLRPTQQAIYDAADAAEAAALAAKAQEEANRAAADSLAAQERATAKLRDEAEKARSALDAMAKAIRNTVATMLGTNPIVAAQTRVEAKATIASNIATLQAGGSAPDESVLKDTLATLSKIDPKNYASYRDYQLDLMGTAGMLNQLASLVEMKSATIPHYAEGGTHMGGAAIVGENGPELVLDMPPSRVFTNQQSSALLDNTDVVIELKAVREYLARLAQNSNSSTADTRKIKDTLVFVTQDGQNMITKDYTLA